MRKFLMSLFVASAVVTAPVYAEDMVENVVKNIGPVFGMAIHGDAKYSSDDRLDYVNPEAPKGGKIRMAAIGTFDNLNPLIVKGVAAAGSNMIYDTLLFHTSDEAFSEYGLVAESFEMPEDRSSVTFNLRAIAKFHDGHPMVAEDVKWTFETLRDKGHPFFRAYYANVKDVVIENDHRVRFDFDVSGNRELPMIIGQMPVLPKHYWADKDFSATTLTPPLGSAAYKIAVVEAGRSISYERVKDYWAEDLPMMQGLYNFDEIQFDYYRDDTVALQAFLAGDLDFRQENTAKTWHSGYNAPAVERGDIIKRARPHMLPTGMQGYVFNLRRDVFKDKAVRKAINYAFDFEWSNKQFAHGSYKRTDNYFENSELASSGLPEGRELKILEQFRDQLPPEVFTTEFTVPKTDGSGNARSMMRQAANILKDAGWALNEEGLRQKGGVVLKFEILLSNAAFERWTAPFIKNLKRLGIEASMRVVDTAQYQNRMDGFDFDMTIGTFGQSQSPGNEQRDFWHSEKADVNGGRNLMGIKNPVIDELIDLVIHAPDRDELIYRTRALDRVLLWGYYLVPQWHINSFRLAYWDKFGYPENPAPYGLDVIETWWVDADKSAQLSLETEQTKE